MIHCLLPDSGAMRTAAPEASSMEQVLTWLFSSGSSSAGGADAASQGLSVSSVQVRRRLSLT